MTRNAALTMLIVDAHLDLAYNALRGRDVLRPAVEQEPDAQGIPTVGLPDLRRGGIGLICGTIFCEPALGKQPGYTTAAEAHDAGWRQLDWYRQQFAAGRLSRVMNRADLPAASGANPDGPTRTIILLEGGDALRTPDDVPAWISAGMRIVGLAWKRTRYAGGTGAPGPLTAEGRDLVRALDAAGIIHDASHLAEESFWNLLEISQGPVIASHSNCRAIVPTDRQLSDDMIRAIVGRGGVIGINFFDKFLLSPGEYGTRRATLDDVLRHVEHICALAGNTHHVGIGTDMDGGLGRNEIPHEITTSADLPRLADLLKTRFSADEVKGIMGGNWLRYYQNHLPQA